MSIKFAVTPFSFNYAQHLIAVCTRASCEPLWHYKHLNGISVVGYAFSIVLKICLKVHWRYLNGASQISPGQSATIRTSTKWICVLHVRHFSRFMWDPQFHTALLSISERQLHRKTAALPVSWREHWSLHTVIDLHSSTWRDNAPNDLKKEFRFLGDIVLKWYSWDCTDCTQPRVNLKSSWSMLAT